MKKEFSTAWISSKQPRKQRKYRANAPLHIKHELVSANLNKELRKKYGRRSFPVRKGDNVKIMRGEFTGKTGKVSIVSLKKLKLAVEGIQKQKKDGTKINIFFQPSNVQIQELSLDDKARMNALSKEKREIKPEKNKEKQEVKVVKEKKAEEKKLEKK